MTTSVFPADKTQPFVADNGVTYVYEADRWRVKQYKLDDAALEDYVEQDEFDSSQGVQDSQINALETQIQLLAQVSAVGKWKYIRNISGGSVRPPATAAFYATHKDGADVVLMNWADARLIMVNKTDLDGTVFTFSDFEEGDKLEILAVDGSSACYGTVTNNPNQDAYGNMLIAVERSSGGPPQNTEKEFLLSVYRPGASNGNDLDALDHRYLIKTGDQMTGPLTFNRNEKDHIQFKISPNGADDFATNIYSLSGQMRFRTTHTSNEGDHVGSHIVLSPNDGSPETKIYNVVEAGETGAVPKSYVDEKVASSGSVPVGSIMMWINSTPPTGWLKLKGESFDIGVYPLLHAYLQQSEGYISGKLPDWRGHYPGQIGDHLNGDVGIKLSQQTAKPSGGSPYSSTSIPNGNTRTFNGAGGTSAYSDGTARPSIDSGWDNVTRPKTVAVHFIIKHD
jgi:hypothetical protein